MVADLFNCVILVAIVKDRAIIRAKNDKGIFCEIQAIQSFHQFADTPVELDFLQVEKQ